MNRSIYLRKDHQGLICKGEFPQEPCVVGEPFYVAFVSTVDKDGRTEAWPAPIMIVQEIALLKGAI